MWRRGGPLKRARSRMLPSDQHIALGLAGPCFLTTLIVTFLFQTTPRDPGAFVAAALLLAACSVIGARIPAGRARVDPVIAPRSE